MAYQAINQIKLYVHVSYIPAFSFCIQVLNRKYEICDNLSSYTIKDFTRFQFIFVIVVSFYSYSYFRKKKIIKKENTVIEENVDTNIYENITQTVSPISADESNTQPVMYMSDRTSKNTKIGTKDVGIPSTSNDKVCTIYFIVHSKL